MAKEDLLKMRGTIVEALRGASFKVVLENGYCLHAGISGKIRQNNIRMIIGDDVDVELSAYDVSKGRIVFRHK